MRKTDFKPLFPWFGGKSAVADLVWSALGPDVKNYVEPFFGSGAVLFGRPTPARIETVNDAPVLSSAFESSVPGLYFAGLAGAMTFGPLMRFMHGDEFAARRITTRIEKSHS